MSHNQTFISWLQDAYAMEVEIAKVLESHQSAAEDYPEVQDKIAEHLEVTKQHAERVKECLEGLGESTSTVKSMIGTMMGAVTGPSTAPFGDQVIKNSMLEYATEHFEMAAYRNLAAAAEELGHPEIVTMCEEILADEEEMEEWLEENSGELISQYLQEKAAEHDE